LDSQDAENEFACPFHTSKYRFTDFTRVVVIDVLKADY
jgi:hypothetical protein